MQLDCNPLMQGFFTGVIVAAGVAIPTIVSLSHTIEHIKWDQSNEYQY